MTTLSWGEQKRRELARRSLYHFVKEFWGEVEAVPFVEGWHMEAICRHLMAVTFAVLRWLLINVPPRHAKSLIVSVFWPAWEFAIGLRNDWLFTSGGYDLALRDSVKCRRILESEKFKRWFPEVQLAPDQNTKGVFDLVGGGKRDCVSAGSRQVTGKGGHRIVTDDLHDANATGNDIATKVDWFTGTLSTRENDPMSTAHVVIMQRIHEKDVSGWILENGGGRWCYLRLPLHYDPATHCKTSIGWEDPRAEPGELLWPERYDESFCKALAKTLGPLRAAGQLEQSPYPADGTEFKSDWLSNRYTALPVSQVERFILSLDASFKGLETSDWCVLGLIAKQGPNYYHCGQVRAKMDYPTLKRRVTEYHASLRSMGIPLSTVLIEDKANGTALIAELARSVSGVVPYNPKDSKIVRYRAISGILAAGQFYLPAIGAEFVFPDGKRVEIPSEFVPGFESELLAIPNGAHDDQADMLAQAILYLEGSCLPEPAGSTFEEGPEIDVYAPERVGRLFR